MKKIGLSILILTLSIISNAQRNKDIDIGLGSSFYSIDTRNSLNFGAQLSLSVKNIHIDFSSNMAKGEGELLGKTEKNYPPNRLRVFLINTGYKMPIGNYFNLCFNLGYGWTRDLYVDPIDWSNHFKGKITNYFNVGFTSYISIEDYAKLYIGIGTFEKFKIGLTYTINQSSKSCR